MSNIVSLAKIREATEKKFGSLIVPITAKDEESGSGVELVNALRLGKTVREKIAAIQEDKDIEVHDRLAAIVELAAKTPAQARRLLDAIGEDTALLAEVVNTYTSGTEVGEASPSES